MWKSEIYIALSHERSTLIDIIAIADFQPNHIPDEANITYGEV